MDVAVQSPCIRNCCLDDDDTCLGCFRSLQEIKEWGTVDNPRRLVILQNAKRRREGDARHHTPCFCPNHQTIPTPMVCCEDSSTPRVLLKK
jgi:uncharacterized protein